MTAAGCDVTVVIPTKDRWHLLSSAALPSALRQEGVDHEVVVVVDGSTDETEERLAEFDDPRLRVLIHERPLGVAHARNAGIRAARGDWVAFLDDDDLWSPRKLFLQLQAAAREAAEFVYAGAAWLDEERAFSRVLPAPSAQGLEFELLRWNVIWAGGSNVMARKELLESVGGFDEQLFQLADWDLWIRLALAAPAGACEEVLVGYVMQPESMLLTDPRDVFLEFDYMVEKHVDASRRLGVALDGAKFSRWVALGRLRAGRRRDAARTYLRGAIAYRDPGSAVRALGALLGPGALPLGRRLLRTAREEGGDVHGSEPPWIALYR